MKTWQTAVLLALAVNLALFDVVGAYTYVLGMAIGKGVQRGLSEASKPEEPTPKKHSALPSMFSITTDGEKYKWVEGDFDSVSEYDSRQESIDAAWRNVEISKHVDPKRWRKIP